MAIFSLFHIGTTAQVSQSLPQPPLKASILHSTPRVPKFGVTVRPHELECWNITQLHCTLFWPVTPLLPPGAGTRGLPKRRAEAQTRASSARSRGGHHPGLCWPSLSKGKHTTCEPSAVQAQVYAELNF